MVTTLLVLSWIAYHRPQRKPSFCHSILSYRPCQRFSRSPDFRNNTTPPHPVHASIIVGFYQTNGTCCGEKGMLTLSVMVRALTSCRLILREYMQTYTCVRHARTASATSQEAARPPGPRFAEKSLLKLLLDMMIRITRE